MNKIIEITDKNLLRFESIKNHLNPEPDKLLIQQTIDYLLSDEAIKSIAIDPYWPKWDSPWWRILLLYEMNLADLIPPKIITAMVDKINTYYIKFFPFTEAELPENIDPVRQIMCHCALGTMAKVLYKLNFDFNHEFYWIREWANKYQLDDGGLNCDEEVYTKANPKSSVVSTLPVLEVLLMLHNLNDQEKTVLDKGAQYLIKKKLFRKQSDNSIIDKDWLEPIFPRFYHYDILRGLSFITEWSLLLERKLPAEAILEALEILDKKINSDYFMTSVTLYFLSDKTRFIDDKNNMERRDSQSFPLLDKFNKAGEANIYLTNEWYKTISNLKKLIEKQLLI